MYTANRQDRPEQDIGQVALLAKARALRAEAAAAMAGDLFARIGRGARSLWAAMERDRADRVLRRELSHLDAHTLKDLGLSPYQVGSITEASLADRPLQHGLPAGSANENAPARENRSAA